MVKLVSKLSKKKKSYSRSDFTIVWEGVSHG